jgi:hypothetical protein
VIGWWNPSSPPVGTRGFASSPAAGWRITVLQRSLDLAEKLAEADPNETSSRIRLASAGREVGNIPFWTAFDPGSSTRVGPPRRLRYRSPRPRRKSSTER